MAAIPTTVFRTVEWHLHRESSLIANAKRDRERAIDRAFASGAGLGDGQPRGKGTHSEATSNRALLLVEAGRDVELARAWVDAIHQTYAYFGDSDVTRMAKRYYGQRVTLRALAGQLGVAEKTLDRHRDKFVATCALFAAAGGLVGVETQGVRFMGEG